VAADNQPKPTNLGCESTCKLLSFTHTTAIMVLFTLKADFALVEGNSSIH